MDKPRSKKTFAVIDIKELRIREKDIYPKADLKGLKLRPGERIALVEIRFIKFIKTPK